MKKSILLLGLFIFIFNCNNSGDVDDIDRFDITGTWKLVEMNGSLPNSTTTGPDMEWQETYVLNGTGTFTKTREHEGETISAIGTYSLLEGNNEMQLQLEFLENSSIIGSCYADNSETMTFESEEVFFSTWQACDGPGLIYEKVN